MIFIHAGKATLKLQHLVALTALLYISMGIGGVLDSDKRITLYED